MIANYHTHTKRCMHAIGEDREYVEYAIKNGLKVLGFADHAPDFGNINNPLVTSVRMPLNGLEGYFYSLSELKKEYKSDIDIRIGLEMEYMPQFFDDEFKILKDYPLEYMLFSSHYDYRGDDISVRHFSHPTNDITALQKFADESVEAMRLGLFSYVCHPDTINFVGKESDYLLNMQKIIDAAVKHDVPLEYNLLGMSLGRHYPTPSFWELLAKQEIKPRVILGCDAHSPERVANPEEVNQALHFLANLGIKPIENLELINPFK